MKINIYYGGRGMIDDPTITVINRMTSVLEELRVNVERFNLYEMKHNINKRLWKFVLEELVLLMIRVGILLKGINTGLNDFN